jgi:hypothetical protein
MPVALLALLIVPLASGTASTKALVLRGPPAVHLPPCGSQHRKCVPYHGGDVMSTTRTYAIFWLPSGRHFEPHGSDGRYERLIIRFLRDVGGTPYYGLLAQYSRSPRGTPVRSGPIRNVSSLGGSYLDTSPYVPPATKAEPLTQAQIIMEVVSVALKKRWPTDPPSLFFVFTAAGAQLCYDFRLGCTSRDLCAWHDGVPYGPIYAEIPDAASHRRCEVAPSPNHDVVADSAINTMTHELFEAVTDPVPCTGFTTGCHRKAGREIGDPCEFRFGHRNPDGSDVVLHDHTYLVQKEWSNRVGKCVLSSSRYPPPHAPPAPHRVSARSRGSGIAPELVAGIALSVLLALLLVALVTARRRTHSP